MVAARGCERGRGCGVAAFWVVFLYSLFGGVTVDVHLKYMSVKKQDSVRTYDVTAC